MIRIRSRLIDWLFIMLTCTICVIMVHKVLEISLTRRAVIVCKLALMVLVVFYHVLIFAREHKLYASDLLIIVYVIYALCVSAANDILIFPNAFVDILTWPCLYTLFKAYIRKSPLPDKFLQMTRGSLILFFFLSIFLIVKHRMGNGNTGGVIFPIYYLIAYLPLYLTLEKDNRWKHGIFLLTVAYLALSTKRAGTVVAVVGYVIFIFTDVRVSTTVKNKFKKYRRLIFGLLIAALVLVVMNSLFSFEVITRLKQIASDGGSGRTSIWIEVMENFEQSDEITKWLGHGYQAVYYRLKPYDVDRLAHNSFLEILYDYGYIGLTIFLLFFLSMVWKIFRACCRKDPRSSQLLISLLICLAFSLSSYLFEESGLMMPIAIFWGCFEGGNYRMQKAGTIRTKRNGR